jgi:hypothetical protein
MPRFGELNDTDAKNVVAFLRSLPAVHRQTPSSECETPMSVTDRGHVLVQQLGCGSCHTGPGTGELAGNEGALPNSMVYAPNLTPDMDTGLGGWADADVARALRTGVDDEGATLCAAMPRYGTMSDDDVTAVVAYLRSLPETRHEVSESVCAEKPAADPDAGTVTPMTDDAGQVDAGAADAGGTDAGHVDAGHVVDAGLVDAGHADAGVVDAGTTTTPAPDAGPATGGLPTDGGTGWVLVTPYAPLPPAWVAPINQLTTNSPSLDALAHVATRVEVTGPLTDSATPCPLPYTSGTRVACDGFNATASGASVVVDEYVYVGATPTCLASLPPTSLPKLTGVWDTHYDFPSHVTTYVVAATSCADLGLAMPPANGTASVPASTDIATQLNPFPAAATPVSVHGVVIATHVTTTSYTFVIEDPRGGPHSGVVVVKKKAVGFPLGAAPDVGSYVRVYGAPTTTATGRTELSL